MRSRTAALAVALSCLFLAAHAFTTRPAVGAAQDEKPAAKAAFEVYKDNAGEYRWRLRTQNTQVIATSGDGYKEKRACLDAIDSVKRNAADAPVKEMQ
jgi:uncharacterized protein YegP (UPF0339 family)